MSLSRRLTVLVAIAACCATRLEAQPSPAASGAGLTTGPGALFDEVVTKAPSSSPASKAMPAPGSKAVPAPETRAPQGNAEAAPLKTDEMDRLFLPQTIVGKGADGRIAIIYNGFRRSSIDPCGCLSHKLGGMDKEARLPARLGELGFAMVKVDAGGFVREPLSEASEIRNNYLLMGLADMKYDAINVSMGDMALGRTKLLDLQTSLSLPFVSANVVDPATSQPIFAPTRSFTVKVPGGDELRVGVIGVTRGPVVVTSNYPPDLQPKPPQEFAVLDPIKAIEARLPEVRAKNDIVILLDYENRSTLQQQLGKMGATSGIDVAVAGEYQGVFNHPDMVGGTRLVSGGFEGRQVGNLVLDIKDKKIAAMAHQMVEVLQTIPPVGGITKHLEAAQKEVLQPPKAAPPQAAAAGKPAAGGPVPPIGAH